uniref:Monothiol glutaredoxin-5 n=1 Tax=Coccidioides posadasii RMSCC 3488 TaxID=454284 RepID=A0A0J6FK84_COCPO|nr:monothiol glutaredoxin-5 [Coccidioides posadasii RMSCC 3488]
MAALPFFCRAVRPASHSLRPLFAPTLSPLQIRLLSTEMKAAIDKAVASAPVVLFMKGTPETRNADIPGPAFRFWDFKEWTQINLQRLMYLRILN